MEKKYLYHMVPVDEDGKENMEGDFLYPLNELQKKNLELYLQKIKKYENGDSRRKNVPNQNIPTLEGVKWGDVVQLSAIHPNELEKELKDAYKKAGIEERIKNFREIKFYEIDPDILGNKNTTVYLYKDIGDRNIKTEDIENYENFDIEKLNQHSVFPESTKKYYEKILKDKERPLLFVGIPHIFHNGVIDISKAPVISIFKKE